MSPVIEVKGVSKSFDFYPNRATSLKRVLVNAMRGDFKTEAIKQHVLDDVSFDIFPGEFVGIMGRNGAGKSTILKIIAGIYKPNSGEVRIHGKLAPLLELGAGFEMELSGYENIFLNAAIIGFSNEQTKKAVETIIEFSELGDHIHMPVKNYSSGMLIRLGFSIAVHLEAPLLLFDEILAVGDAGFQNKSMNKIKELHAEGRSIVLVTHSPDAVLQHCNRCIVIKEHRVIFDGDTKTGTDLYMSEFH